MAMIETTDTPEDVERQLELARGELKAFEDAVDAKRLLARIKRASPSHPVLLGRALFMFSGVMFLLGMVALVAVTLLHEPTAKFLSGLDGKINAMGLFPGGLPTVFLVLSLCMFFAYYMATFAAWSIGRESPMLMWEAKEYQKLVNEVTRLTTQKAVMERIRGTPGGARPRIATPVPMSMRNRGPSSNTSAPAGPGGGGAFGGGFKESVPPYLQDNSSPEPSGYGSGASFSPGFGSANQGGGAGFGGRSGGGGFGNAPDTAPPAYVTTTPSAPAPAPAAAAAGSLLSRARSSASAPAAPDQPSYVDFSDEGPTQPGAFGSGFSAPNFSDSSSFGGSDFVSEETKPKFGGGSGYVQDESSSGFGSGFGDGGFGGDAAPNKPPFAAAESEPFGSGGFGSGSGFGSNDTSENAFGSDFSAPKKPDSGFGGASSGFGGSGSGFGGSNSGFGGSDSGFGGSEGGFGSSSSGSDAGFGNTPPTNPFEPNDAPKAAGIQIAAPSVSTRGGTPLGARPRAGVALGSPRLASPMGFPGTPAPSTGRSASVSDSDMDGLSYGAPEATAPPRVGIQMATLKTKPASDPVMDFGDIVETTAPGAIVEVSTEATREKGLPNWGRIDEMWLEEAIEKAENMVRAFPEQAKLSFSNEEHLPFTLVIERATPAMAVRAMVNYVEFLSSIYTPRRARIELRKVAHLDRSFHRNVDAALQPYFAGKVTVENNGGQVDITFQDPDPSWDAYPTLPMQ